MFGPLISDRIWIKFWLGQTSQRSTLSPSKMPVGRDVYFSLVDGRLRAGLLTTFNRTIANEGCAEV